jgi:hypothetical protein
VASLFKIERLLPELLGCLSLERALITVEGGGTRRYVTEEHPGDSSAPPDKYI